jgi:hypothetical protein
MAKERGSPEQDSRSPLSPDPPAFATALQGMEEGRALARRYLVNVVRLQAAIAFGRNTEAGLHTRMLAAKSIADIAGAVPQSTPVTPSLDRPANGSGGQS